MRNFKEVFWVVPHVFLITVIFPICLVIIYFARSIVESNYIGYESPYYVSDQYSLMFAGGVLILAAGTFFGGRVNKEKKNTLVLGEQSLDFLFWMTAIAYLIWFMPALLINPSLIFGALLGEAGSTYRVRELNLNISGLTTVTQFGIAYVSIYAYERWISGRFFRSKYFYYFCLIFAMGLFRAWVNSERIALLELIFPVIVVLSCSTIKFNKIFRFIIGYFPIITMLAAPVFFAIFEYNRSWLIHYSNYYDSILDFSTERLGVYYISSLNNISGYLDYANWPSYSGEWTLRWLYRFPWIGDLVSYLFGSGDFQGFNDFLGIHADPEYNNTTGIMVTYQDWGAWGAVFLFALGFIIGKSYRSFVCGSGWLKYIYPMMFYALYEILRIGYLYDGRFVSAVIGVLVCVVLLRNKNNAV
ncbi:O-antigen polymerase [Azonexus fungiphilus]|uniref:O-antigen polymerase n=1 Tax=Azonexus fungiphilus TaxID=146940 RepID=UPI00156AD1B1|nr:O-antigen polymerase [Azonexus fungiphilus]NHC07546.1 oligosaccharide repeat unit polymerase [Azonexus fungiphilus]